VEAVSGVLRRRIILPKDNNPLDDVAQIEMIGVDLATLSAVRTYDLREGRMIEGEGEAVVTAEVDDLGETISLTTANGLQSYTIVGILKADLVTEQVIVTLSDAQAALNLAGQTNLLQVSFSDGADQDTVTSAVKRALGDRYLYNATVGGEYSAAQIGTVIFNLFGMIALFMGGFLIFNTFRTVVVERRHDLAMLRAIGATRRQITQLILIESVLQGVLGTLMAGSRLFVYRLAADYFSQAIGSCRSQS
jgi:putative ABC transport system permease protein